MKKLLEILKLLRISVIWQQYVRNEELRAFAEFSCAQWRRLVFVTCGLLLGLTVTSSTSASPVAAATRVFYDGSEEGNTNLWNQDDTRNRCVSIASSADGQVGPYAGSKMIRCNSNGTVIWTDPARFETLSLRSFALGSEVLYRSRIRLDQNHAKTPGSTKKLLRLFNWTGDYSACNDIYTSCWQGTGLGNASVINGDQLPSYWGDAPGDRTGETSSWHLIEYYLNKSTGVLKVWHDDVLVNEHTFGPVKGPVGESGEFYLTSNFEDEHDSLNYVYFDEFEVYTDSTSGTSAAGFLADGSAHINLTPPTLQSPSGLRIGP